MILGQKNHDQDLKKNVEKTELKFTLYLQKQKFQPQDINNILKFTLNSTLRMDAKW
jgi:hypothetical protein